MKYIHKIAPFAAIAAGAVLALATSAFNKAPKAKNGFTNYAFEYTGPDYTVADVENVNNWTYEASSPSCSGNQEACSLDATDSYVDNSGSSPVLKSTINIQATLTPLTGTARVTGIADPNGSFTNQLK